MPTGKSPQIRLFGVSFTRHLCLRRGSRAPKTYGSGDVHILAIDCGIKYNIIRSLVSKGIKVPLGPSRALHPWSPRWSPLTPGH